MNIKNTFFVIIFFFLNAMIAKAQYHPAAGEFGSSAIHKDSSIIKSWAKNCVVTRGFLNIADTTATYSQGGITSNHAFFGHDTLALGKPVGNMNCVSLGDGGSAILEFEKPIKNGEGADFVIFENGFKYTTPPYMYFLELAFVEVSSDGQKFVRFPSYSNTDTTTQIDGFGQLDPTKIHNLAGKYITDFGTPFDLDDISDSTGIDLNNITHVKIIDVIGNINPQYASYDILGRPINDPWPTPFWSGGFDLNAVGVIHMNEEQAITDFSSGNKIQVYPNPVKTGQKIVLKIQATPQEVEVSIYDITGKKIISNKYNENPITIDIPADTPKGFYIIKANSTTNYYTKKIVIQ